MSDETKDQEVGVTTSNVVDIRKAVEERQAKVAEDREEKKKGGDEGGGLSSSFVVNCLKANELGDGILYAHLNKGQFLFCHTMNHYLIWDGHHWSIDVMERSHYAVEKVCEVYRKEISRIYSGPDADPDEKLVKLLYQRIHRLRSGVGRRACLSFAHQCEFPLAIHGEEIDTKPYLLPCQNGVVDLQTGEFGPGRPEDYLLKAAPVEWKGIDAQCPEWERALSEIFSDNEDLVQYNQRLLGYSITGDVREHIFPVYYGQGRNGKSLIVNTISGVLGDLAVPINPDMLLDQGMSRGSSGPTPDIMGLKGARITFASETDQGRKISPSRVKWLTGGDELVGRAPHDKYETHFWPTHTLILLTNNKPHAPAEDFAFWKRVHLIPFLVSFVRDPQEENERPIDMDLPKKLLEERSGILAWLVRGCLQWQNEGLNPPPIVKQATAEYRRDEDLLADFVEECCDVGPGYEVGATALYKAFVEWWKECVGKRPPSQRTFGHLVGKKFEKEKRRGGYQYYGLCLHVNA